MSTFSGGTIIAEHMVRELQNAMYCKISSSRNQTNIEEIS